MAEDKERFQSNKRYLQENQEFERVPPRMRGWILNSPHASSDFSEFFKDGGKIYTEKNIQLPYYLPSHRETNKPTIVIDESTYNALVGREAHKYDEMARAAFSTIAHEIGHHRHNTMRSLFRDNGSIEEYVTYRSELEARSILNAFPIFEDLRQNDPSFKPEWKHLGYLAFGAETVILYRQWSDGHDVEAIVKKMARNIPNCPYERGGIPDLNGDGLITHRDVFINDYPKVLRKDKENLQSVLDQRYREPFPVNAAPTVNTSSSQTDILFDRMYEALASKDSQAMRAARQDYFQSQDGQQFLQEVGEYRQAQEHRAHAQGLSRSPDGYSIGALTGKRDPRDWDHPDHALYSAIRRQLPAEVPDDMAAHVMLQAKQGGVDRADKIDAVAAHDGKAWVLGKNFAGQAHVDLSQSPPAMQETVRQSEIFDQQQAQQREQWLAQEQQLSRDGPSMSR